jgi:hypothetical protein
VRCGGKRRPPVGAYTVTAITVGGKIKKKVPRFEPWTRSPPNVRTGYTVEAAFATEPIVKTTKTWVGSSVAEDQFLWNICVLGPLGGERRVAETLLTCRGGQRA